MKFLKGLIKLSLIGSLVLVVVALSLYVLMPTWEPMLREEIQGLARSSGYYLKIEEIRLTRLYPVGVELSNISVRDEKSTLQGEIYRVLAQVRVLDVWPNPLESRLQIDINVQRPKIKWEAPQKEDSSAKTEATAGSLKPVALTGYKTHWSIHFSDAQIEMSGPVNLQLSQFHLEANGDELFTDTPIQAEVNSKVTLNYEGLSVSLPLEIKAPAITAFGSKIEIPSLHVDVGGLGLTGQGSSDLESGRHDWKINMAIDDLAKMPIPPKILPAGEWSGELKAFAHFVKSNQETRVEGQALARAVRAQLKVDTPEMKVSGPTTMNAELQLSYNQGELNLKKFLIDAELSDLEISKDQMFFKPAGTPLKTVAKGYSSKGWVVVDEALAQFAQINLKASGYIGQRAGQKSKFHVEIPDTDISGIDKFLPPLKSYPLRGFLSAKAQIEGDLFNPEQLSINVNPLQVRKLSGNGEFKNADSTIQVSGPFFFDLNGRLITRGAELVDGQLNLNGDFKAMNIAYADQFQKKAGEPLGLKAQANKKGERFVIDSLGLNSKFATLGLTGWASHPAEPRFDFNIDIKKADLQSLGQVLPSLRPFNLTGAAEGKIALKGTFNFDKGLKESPIFPSGELTLKIPKYTHTSSEKTPSPSDQKEKESPVLSSILPNWVLLRNLNARVNVDLDEFDYGDLKINQLKANLHVNRGVLSGQAGIGRLFAGSIQLNSFSMPLLEVPSVLSSQLSFKSLDLQEAVGWVTPEYKSLVAGRAAGQFKIKAPWPNHGNIMTETQVNGRADVSDFFVSTLKLDEMANSILSKIPGQSGKKVETKGLKGKLSSQLAFGNAKLNFSNLQWITAENNEFQGEGWFSLDKMIGVKGKLFIANATNDKYIKACLADKTGRLVVPVEYQGSILEPKFSYAEKALGKLASDFLNCRARLAADDMRQAAKRELAKEVDKTKKKVEEEAKKKLQNLFK